MNNQTRWETYNSAGTKLHEQGRYVEAEKQFLAALQEVEKLGQQDSRVATILNNLANLYHNQNKYSQAEPLYQRALAIREEILGSQHPIVAQSLNNLAALYRDQGKYAEAEPLFQRSLVI